MKAKGIRLQGELGISRKAIARGMPECSDCTCMLVCAFLCTHCTRDRGCSVHPAFPAPSVFEGGDKFMQASGAMRRENANAHSVVIVREGGRSSILETSMIEPKGCGVLDTSPSLGTTISCASRYPSVIASESEAIHSAACGDVDCFNDVKRPRRTAYPRI